MNNNEKEIEELSKAVTNAISNSKEVKSALAKLKDVDENCFEGLLILMIRIKTLIDVTANDLPDIKQPKEETAQLLNVPHIDGKKLTPDELAFHEYCSKKFNVEKWLIENKINFTKTKKTT